MGPEKQKLINEIKLKKRKEKALGRALVYGMKHLPDYRYSEQHLLLVKEMDKLFNEIEDLIEQSGISNEEYNSL